MLTADMLLALLSPWFNWYTVVDTFPPLFFTRARFDDDKSISSWLRVRFIVILTLFCDWWWSPPPPNPGDCGFELGGDIITFLLMSMRTAAVSKCCCNCVRRCISSAVAASGGIVDTIRFIWFAVTAALICPSDFFTEIRFCCFGFEWSTAPPAASIGITDTELASKWSIWFLLSIEVTIAFVLAVFLFNWWWLLLLRSSVSAAAAVCSDASRHDGRNSSSKLVDVWFRTSCQIEREKEQTEWE